MQGVEGGGQGLVLTVRFGEALCAGKMEGDSSGGSYSNLSLESGERRESRCPEGRGPGGWCYNPEQGRVWECEE